MPNSEAAEFGVVSLSTGAGNKHAKKEAATLNNHKRMAYGGHTFPLLGELYDGASKGGF
jgi:hypothetical protein